MSTELSRFETVLQIAEVAMMAIFLGSALYWGSEVFYPKQLANQPTIQFRSERYDAQYSLVCDFETLGDWTKVTGESIASDTEHFKEGNQGIKFTSVNHVQLNAEKDVTLNAIGKHFTLWVYVDNIDNLSVGSFYLLFRDTPISKYLQINVLGLKTGWNKAGLCRGNCTKWGGAVDDDWTSITRIRVKFNSVAGTTLNITLDDFRAVEDRFAGKVTLRFDDITSGHYTEARPRMDKYGYRGVEFVNVGNVGARSYLTLSQLKHLQERGWDIASHTVTHKYFVVDSLTDSEVEYELYESQRWLVENGFIKGSRFFGPPGDDWNTSHMEKIKQYYVGCSTRSCGTQVYASIPPADPYRLGLSKSVSATTPLAHVQEIIDLAKTYNAWVTLYFHDITDMSTLFQNILDYINSSGLEVVTLSDVFDDLIAKTALQNSGAATLTATTASVNVTHLLTTTPTRVILTPTTDTARKRFWVSAKAATTFTVTIDSTHTSDITFDWRAIAGEG